MPVEWIYVNKKKIDYSVSESRIIFISIYYTFFISFIIMYKGLLCDKWCKSGGQMVHDSVTFSAWYGDVWCIQPCHLVRAPVTFGAAMNRTT